MMKYPRMTYALFMFFFMTAGMCTYAQDPKERSVWTKADSPVAHPLESVYFINADRGWAVGWQGHILGTEDGGKTWKILRGPTSDGLRDVFFVDSKNGWVVGGLVGSHHGSIYPPIVLKTEDGGKTWAAQNDLVQGAEEFSRVLFRGEVGWILGTKRSWVTKDGGKTWTKLITTGLDAILVQNAFFFDSEFGAHVRETKVRTTQDGGATWAEKDLASDLPAGSWLRRVFFVSKKVGWAVGVTDTKVDGQTRDDSLVVKTEDGGGTWKVVGRETNGGDVTDVFFISQSTGWIITRNHPEEKFNIMQTTDGGKTWKAQFRAQGPTDRDDHVQKGEPRPQAMFFTSASHGVAVGTDGLILRFGTK